MSFQSPYGANAAQNPVAANPHPVTQQAPAAPVAARRTDPVVILSVIGFIVLGIIAILVALYMLYAVGPVAVVVAFFIALVPLGLVIWAIAWIDRWDPEPRAALLFALLWGAAAAVAIALIFSFGAQIVQAIAGVAPSAATDFFGTVIQAPVVEEGAKGLGILILFWAFRKHFDGPVDGLVYGSTIAVGFAFTENIQYFGVALTSTDLGGVAEIAFLRGILSPFAHVMFTAFTGIILGLAARRTGPFGAIGYFILGLIPAILLHAFWNVMAVTSTNFYVYYAVVQVPLFLLAIGFVIFLRRKERQVTAARLSEYAAVGWFTPTEVALLSTGAGRNQARQWASRHGLGAQFTTFVKDATRLAFARQRVVSGRDNIRARQDEADLLARITAGRQALAALPPMPIQPGPVR